MHFSDYFCILEDNYVDSDSWDYDTVECRAPDAVSAAVEAVEIQEDILGLNLALAGSDENVGILVKNLETGEIVRVCIEARRTVQVSCARRDKNFIAPKE